MSTRVDNRIWALITVVVCLGLLAAAWFLGAQPFFAQAQTANDSRAAVDQKNSATRATIAALAAAKSDLPKLKDEADALEKSIPYSVGGSSFIRSVTKLASDSGVTVSSIKLEDPTAYTVPSAQPAATATGATGAGSTPAPSDSASPSPTPTVDPVLQAALPYSNPSITSSNFTIVPFSVEVTGPQPALLAFTKALQHGDRLALVTGVNYTAGAGSGDADGPKIVLSGNLYVLNPKATTSAAANG